MREDILGALKSALIRGETLKKAMMTLYNAGYKKNDIEEAAASLQQIIQPRPIGQNQTTTTPPQLSTKPKSTLSLVLIILSLIVLVGILIGSFLFSSELIEFFNKVFN